MRHGTFVSIAVLSVNAAWLVPLAVLVCATGLDTALDYAVTLAVPALSCWLTGYGMARLRSKVRPR